MIPATIAPAPAQRASNAPRRHSFSTPITAAITAITARFITPRIICITIRAQQHAAQNAPWTIPTRTAPLQPGRHTCPRKRSGERQCRKHACFSGESWYTPARIKATLAPAGITRLRRSDCIATDEIQIPSPNETAPKASQTAKYPVAASVTLTQGLGCPVDTATR